MQYVYVLNKHGEPLMPCSPRKARLLLKQHKACYVCINGEDVIDEMYYPFELDLLPVVGIGYANNGNTLTIDLSCINWGKRYEPDWISKP